MDSYSAGYARRQQLGDAKSNDRRRLLTDRNAYIAARPQVFHRFSSFFHTFFIVFITFSCRSDLLSTRLGAEAYLESHVEAELQLKPRKQEHHAFEMSRHAWKQLPKQSKRD